MADYLHRRRLFASPAVTITDVRCRPHDCGCSAEECGRQDTLVFPRRGLFLRHIGRDELVADANHVHFFRADEAYRVSHPVEGGDDCTSIAFADGILRDAAGRWNAASPEHAGTRFAYAHALSSPRTHLRYQRLRRMLLSGWGDALAVEEAAIELLDETLSMAHSLRGRRAARAPRDTGRVHRALADAARQTLIRHLAEPLTLAELGRRVHASPFHLARLFRVETGLSIHQYRNRLRLAAALERLSGGDRDLTALALDLGYAGHSHFTEAFRMHFGVPPSEFRRIDRDNPARQK